MLGKTVTDRNGANVGVINDLIIEPDRGMIIYIVLELQTGTTRSIPYNAITFDSDTDNHLTLNMDHQTLLKTKRRQPTQTDN